MVLVPEGLADLGARQFGLVARGQALEYWTTGQLVRRLDQRVVIRDLRGVYRFPGAPRSWRQRALAATLCAGGPVALHGLAAAYLWQVEQIASPPVTLAVPLGRSGRGPSCRVVRTQLPAGDLADRYGIPVTTPVRTVIDLSGVVNAALLGAVADDLIRRRLLSVGELEARLEDPGSLGRRRPGALGDLCRRRRSDERPGGSVAEDWVFDTISRAGLPLPLRHYPVWIAGQWRELDFAYPLWRIAIEYDSAEFHRDLRRFHGDRARAAELALEGWLLLSVTAGWSEATLLDRLRRAISRRGLR